MLRVIAKIKLRYKIVTKWCALMPYCLVSSTNCIKTTSFSGHDSVCSLSHERYSLQDSTVQCKGRDAGRAFLLNRETIPYQSRGVCGIPPLLCCPFRSNVGPCDHSNNSDVDLASGQSDNCPHISDVCLKQTNKQTRVGWGVGLLSKM